MNTMVSHDQFQPIRIGENLVVNYNDMLIVCNGSVNQITAIAVVY